MPEGEPLAELVVVVTPDAEIDSRFVGDGGSERDTLAFDSLRVFDKVVEPVREDGCDSESDLELVCDLSIDDDAVALETL